MGGELFHSLLFNAASQVATLADAASAFAAFGLAVWPRTRWNGVSQAWETVAEVDGLYPLLLGEDGRAPLQFLSLRRRGGTPGPAARRPAS